MFQKLCSARQFLLTNTNNSSWKHLKAQKKNKYLNNPKTLFMETTTNFDTIISKLRLTSELKQAHICLEEFTNNYFSHENNANIDAYCSKLPGDLPQLFKELFMQRPSDSQNQTTYKNKIDELVTKLYKCRIVELTLAFKPDNNTIAYFSDWIKKNVGSDVVIDLQFNPSIVGGAQIIYNGMYKDYSIRKKLAGTFQIHRDEITHLLK